MMLQRRIFYIADMHFMMDYMDYAPRTLDELLAVRSDKSAKTNQEG